MLVVGGLIGIFYPFLHRGALIDPVPPILSWAGAAIFGVPALLVSVAAYRAKSRIGGYRTRLGLIFLPFAAALLGVAWTGLAVEAYAFAGQTVTFTRVQAPVVTTADRRPGRPFTWATVFVRPAPGSRELAVTASDALYRQSSPRPGSASGCVLLDVDTGRGGRRRTFLPNIIDPPFDLDRWTDCRARSTIPDPA